MKLKKDFLVMLKKLNIAGIGLDIPLKDMGYFFTLNKFEPLDFHIFFILEKFKKRSLFAINVITQNVLIPSIYMKALVKIMQLIEKKHFQ